MLTTTLVTIALAFAANAQSASQLATLDAQWAASGFDAALPNSNSFGVPLNAQALLTVQYGSVQVENGQSLTAAQVAALPTITVTPAASAAANFSSSNSFTLFLADANAAGGADPEGDYRHYLANSISGSGNGETAFQLQTGTVVTPYAGPGPLPGSGTHRYAWVLVQQPAGFVAPAGFNQAGHWQVSSYLSQAKLGQVVAASWFTVSASGSPTFAPVSTTAVASITASAAAGASASTGGDRLVSAGAPSSSSAAAPATTSAKSGASIMAPAAGLAGLVALVGGIMA